MKKKTHVDLKRTWHVGGIVIYEQFPYCIHAFSIGNLKIWFRVFMHVSCVTPCHIPIQKDHLLKMAINNISIHALEKWPLNNIMS